MDFSALVAIMALSPTTPLVGSPDQIIGQFKNTYYYIAQEADYPREPKTQELKDMNGRVLARVSEKFRKELFIEGTGKLMSGKVINFAGRSKDGESRYRITPNPYGDGIGSCALVPFHTVAVDPEQIQLGSVIRIAETVGMKLPDGTVHDGLWRAEDIGSAIKGLRIDLFVGAGKHNARALDAQGIQNMQALSVELVSAPTKDSCAGNEPPESLPPDIE